MDIPQKKLVCIEDDVEMVVTYDDLIESELQALLVEFELETDPKGLEVW